MRRSSTFNEAPSNTMMSLEEGFNEFEKPLWLVKRDNVFKTINSEGPCMKPTLVLMPRRDHCNHEHRESPAIEPLEEPIKGLDQDAFDLEQKVHSSLDGQGLNGQVIGHEDLGLQVPNLAAQL